MTPGTAELRLSPTPQLGVPCPVPVPGRGASGAGIKAASPAAFLSNSPSFPSLQPPGFAFPLNNTLGELRLAPTPSWRSRVLRCASHRGQSASGAGRQPVPQRHQQDQRPAYARHGGVQPTQGCCGRSLRFHRRAQAPVYRRGGGTAHRWAAAASNGRGTNQQPIHNRKEVIHQHDEPGIPIPLQEVGPTTE